MINHLVSCAASAGTPGADDVAVMLMLSAAAQIPEPDDTQIASSATTRNGSHFRSKRLTVCVQSLIEESQPPNLVCSSCLLCLVLSNFSGQLRSSQREEPRNELNLQHNAAPNTIPAPTDRHDAHICRTRPQLEPTRYYKGPKTAERQSQKIAIRSALFCMICNVRYSSV